MWREPRVRSGRCGDHVVESFQVSETEAENYNRLARIRQERSYVPPGLYYRLMRRGDVVMSNTPDEYREHANYIRCARGRVLVVGLGLGLVLDKLIEKSDVKEIVVVERELEVIRLVGTAFMRESKVRIVRADLNDWWPRPDQFGRFESAWIDIWDVWDDSMMPEYRRARNHVAGVVAPVNAFCWKEREIKNMIRNQAQ